MGRVRVYEGAKTNGSSGLAPCQCKFENVTNVSISDSGGIVTVFQKNKKGMIVKSQNTLVIVTDMKLS